MNNFHGIELAAGTAAFLARPRRMLIGAEWQEAASGETLPVIDPASGEAFCRVPAGDAADIDRAVAAARHAFEASEWSRMRPVDRERLLLRLADLVEAHAQELAGGHGRRRRRPAGRAAATESNRPATPGGVLHRE